MGRKPGFGRPLAERLAAKTVASPDSDCLLWTGHRNKRRGYGQIAVKVEGGGYKLEYTHRVAWSLTNGPIPPGKHVMHSCDTTNCVNPEHLSLGTDADNKRDMMQKRRHAHGTRSPSAKLSEDDVRNIRFLHRQKGYTLTELCKMYPIKAPAMSFLLHGKTWRFTEPSMSEQA
jgi:hypothetical protein